MKYTVTRKNDAGSTVTSVELVTDSLPDACARARQKIAADDAQYSGSKVKMAGNFWTVEDESGEYYCPQTEQP